MGHPPPRPRYPHMDLWLAQTPEARNRIMAAYERQVSEWDRVMTIGMHIDRIGAILTIGLLGVLILGLLSLVSALLFGGAS